MQICCVCTEFAEMKTLIKDYFYSSNGAFRTMDSQLEHTIIQSLINFNVVEGKVVARIERSIELLKKAKQAIYMSYKFDMITTSTYNMYMRRANVVIRRLRSAHQGLLR